MTGVAGQRPMGGPCPRCTGMGGVHYLTCPTLRLPATAEDLADAAVARAARARIKAGEPLVSWEHIIKAVAVPP